MRRSELDRDPLLDRLDQGLVKVATIVAGLFFVLLFSLGVASDRSDFLQQSLTPGVTAAVGVVMMWRRSPKALVQLAVSGIMVIFYVGFADRELQGTAIIGLVTMGMAGSLFVRRHLLAYTAITATVVTGATIWWDEGGPLPLEDRFLIGSGPILLFIFVAWVLGWLRRELQAGQTRYRNLFDHAPVGIFESDCSDAVRWIEQLRAAGVSDLRAYFRADPNRLLTAASRVEILNANREGTLLLGGSDPTDITGQFSRHNPPSWVELVGEVMIALWHGEQKKVIEAPFVTLRGDHREAIATLVVPHHDGMADYGQVVLTLIDVTERNAAQRSLERTLQSRDEFVASVSHELRTPLTAVVGLAEELHTRQTDFSPDEVHEFVQLIAGGANEMAYLVEDLLVAARSEEGRLQLQRRQVELAAEAVAVVAGQSEEIAIEVDGESPLVLADPVRVRQIVRNLLGNARRYGSGTVRVHIAKDETVAHLAVSDEGAPIPEAMREQIFDAYYRARPVDGMTSSVGLGLTVSRQLARMMGGELSYTHNGRESVFTLSLPRIGTAPTTEEPAAVPAARI